MCSKNKFIRFNHCITCHSCIFLSRRFYEKKIPSSFKKSHRTEVTTEEEFLCREFLAIEKPTIYSRNYYQFLTLFSYFECELWVLCFSLPFSRELSVMKNTTFYEKDIVFKLMTIKNWKICNFATEKKVAIAGKKNKKSPTNFGNFKSWFSCKVTLLIQPVCLSWPWLKSHLKLGGFFFAFMFVVCYYEKKSILR